MLVGGEAELDGVPLELFTFYVLRPGHEARFRARAARLMLMGGGPSRRPATSSGTSCHRRASGSIRRRRTGRRCAFRWSRATTRSSSRFPRCRRRSAIRDEFRRVALSDRRDSKYRAGGDRANPRRDPAPWLYRIAPHLARDRAAARAIEFHLVMPDQRGFASPTGRRTTRLTRPTLLVDDIFALADALGLVRFALVGHDGAARSPGRRRFAAIRADTPGDRQAPHPVIFQKSLIENADQRAASQYITAFRSARFRRKGRAMGCAGSSTRLRRPCRPRRSPKPRSGNISPNGAPGALTACSTGIARSMSWCRRQA